MFYTLSCTYELIIVVLSRSVSLLGSSLSLLPDGRLVRTRARTHKLKKTSYWWKYHKLGTKWQWIIWEPKKSSQMKWLTLRRVDWLVELQWESPPALNCHGVCFCSAEAWQEAGIRTTDPHVIRSTGRRRGQRCVLCAGGSGMSGRWSLCECHAQSFYSFAQKCGVWTSGWLFIFNVKFLNSGVKLIRLIWGRGYVWVQLVQYH